MLGQAVINGRSSSYANNRVFVYEVTGLRQNQENDANSYAFRSSGSIFFTVPYARMNEEMQRIGKMGGTIVNIKSLEEFKAEEGTIAAASDADSPDGEADSSSDDDNDESQDNGSQKKSSRKKKKGFKGN